MTTDLSADVARRLKAIREELQMDPPAMANWLGVGRTRYLNWERADNLPSEDVMVDLCERTGLTLDYIYRGLMDAVPAGLAIRVAAREQGLNPDAPDFRPEKVVLAVGRAIQRV